MAILGFELRRFIVCGGLIAATALVPAIVSVAGPNAMTAIPLAACAPGEHKDPVTHDCSPRPGPAGVVDAPGLNEQWREQDVYDTPGEAPGHAGGTTVP